MFKVLVTDGRGNDFGVLAFSQRLDDFALSRHTNEAYEFETKEDADYQAKKFNRMLEYYNFYTVGPDSETY